MFFLFTFLQQLCFTKHLIPMQNNVTSSSANVTVLMSLLGVQIVPCQCAKSCNRIAEMQHACRTLR